VTGGGAREVLAVRYCNRTTTRAENFLNHHLYGEPNTDIVMDYYFWVVSDGSPSGHRPPARGRPVPGPGRRAARGRF